MTRGDENLKKFGDLTIDTHAKLLWFRGTPVHVPPKEIDILCFLVEKGGNIATKEELIDALWPGTFVEEGIFRATSICLEKGLDP